MLDRSKFKSTKVATLEKDDKDLEATTGKKNGFQNDFLKMDVGKNTFRIYPAHPDDNDPEAENPFAEPKTIVRLKVPQVKLDDNGKPVIEKGKIVKEDKVKVIFNSRLHGGTEKDLVDEYVKEVFAIADEMFKGTDKKVVEAKKTFLIPIYGKYDKNQDKNIQGILYTNTWVAYADKYVNGIPTFGRWEIKKAVKERLNKIANSQEGSEDPLSFDPFTGIDDGRAVIVTYNDKAIKSTDYYATEIDSAQVPTVIAGKTYQMSRTYPLSDEQLEAYMKVKPMRELLRGVFKRSDFELQLEGLRKFDAENDFQIFSLESFEKTMEEISEYYPEEEEKEDEEGSDGQQEDEGESNSGDMFDIMERKELKSYITDNELGILVTQKHSDDDIRLMIREANLAQNSTYATEESDNEPTGEESSEDDSQGSDEPEGEGDGEETEVKATNIKNIANSRLAQIRQKVEENTK